MAKLKHGIYMSDDICFPIFFIDKDLVAANVTKATVSDFEKLFKLNTVTDVERTSNVISFLHNQKDSIELFKHEFVVIVNLNTLVKNKIKFSFLKQEITRKIKEINEFVEWEKDYTDNLRPLENCEEIKNKIFKMPQ